MAGDDAGVVHADTVGAAWQHYPGAGGAFGPTDIRPVNPDNPLGLDRRDPAAKDDITTINRLNMPIDNPVIVHLSTKDVIHSFGLPEMRIKQDTRPGLSQPVWFTRGHTRASARDYDSTDLNDAVTVAGVVPSTVTDCV